MGPIDLILNVAGVLIWLRWRAVVVDPLGAAAPASLASTLQRPQSRPARNWELLVGLSALLLLRALLYWQLGGAAEWTPRLDFVVVTLAFRNYVLGSAMLYSCLSFVRALAVVYFWMLALATINRNLAEANPVKRMIRLYLGRFGQWPWPVQAVSLLLVVAGVWIAAHPLLLEHRVVDRSQSAAHLMEQGLLIGLGLLFSLKYLLPAVLLLYLVASYVYVGSSPFWDYISSTGRNLLAPLRWAPLRFSRLDLTPLVAAVLILLLLHTLPAYLMHRMAELQQPLWPE